MERIDTSINSNRSVLTQESMDRSFYFAGKRILDTSLVVFALILLAPLIALIALLIKMDSDGPAFFVQKRVGARRRLRNGRMVWEHFTFDLYKFRTMTANNDNSIHKEYMAAYISGDTEKLAELQQKQGSADSFKMTQDPRVTKIGSFLRRTSLDELPQLWNILKGEMSIVGPRPPIPYEVEMYRVDQRRRLDAIPGLTGLWQVSGRCITSFDEMVELDLEYVRMQSLWLDIKIILLTIPAALSSKGAG